MAGAAELFARALAGFSALLSDPRFRPVLGARATRIPGSHPAEVAEAFLNELPGWLVELHFERLSRALSEEKLPVARGHWRLIEGAARLPGLQRTADLDLLRDRLCQRFLPNPDALSQVGSIDRRKVIGVAERLLQVDPPNASARMFALRGYLLDLQHGLDRLSRARSRKDDLLPHEDMKPGAERRLRSGFRRQARRLRRHVTVLSRTSQRGQPDVSDGYLTLCRYYRGINERELAVRMARRARRLSPADSRIRRLVRQLRCPRRRR